MIEQEILRSLVLLAEDTVDFLSNKRKWERECWVCTEFFKALKINISQSDPIKASSKPPDVICRGANFEVFIVLDEGRKLHGDWKQKLSKYSNSQSLVNVNKLTLHLTNSCYTLRHG